MREIKIDGALKKSNFLFPLCLKIAIIESTIRTEIQHFSQLFCMKFDASTMFTGLDIDQKHSLQLNNNLKLCFHE